MPNIIEPVAKIVDYGPKLFFSNGVKMTPDEFVYAAANITYKDTGALREFMELKESDADLESKVKSALIKVAGAGHASMATTPGFWVFLEGNCSKLVDSIFTGARFASSLMPSGRRVGIDKSQIVVPRGIAEAGGSTLEIYLKTSENNMRVYEEVQKRGVPKQEASKIVQYGHRGGGFMFMPLETFIYFSRLAEEDSIAMPEEGRQIISQIEQQMKEMGMNITYQARKEAPRTGTVNPNIFHFGKNLAGELMDSISGPTLIGSSFIPSQERDDRINNYLLLRKQVFRNPELIKKDWRYLLTEMDQIVRDFNDTVSVVTAVPTPWRIWGEVKRHRTLPQTAESVYFAVDRALRAIRENKGNPEIFGGLVSLPPSVRQDPENFAEWISATEKSLKAYGELVERGIPESDAIAVVPRGLKLGVVKKFDLYNLTLGYMSLRLCDTAEPEMRRTTEHERSLFLDSLEMPEMIKSLIDPKCIYTGFCPEKSRCQKILKAVPDYNDDFHKEFEAVRIDDIKSKLL